MLNTEYKPYAAALQRATNLTTTDNGAIAEKNTLNACVDFFFGTLKDEEEYYNLFKKALLEEQNTAMQILFWHRDCRGTGQGRRKNFRFVLSKLNEWKSYYTGVPFSCNSIFHYGRADDMLTLLDTSAGKDTLVWIKTQINAGNGLVAKWLPRESGKNRFLARRIAKFLGLSAKEYRKLLVQNTRVTETKMCSNKWSEIEYSKVPSQCFLRSRNAFKRNDNQRFENFVSEVKEGKAEVKVATLLPNEIVSRYLKTGWDFSPKDLDDSLEILWDALPKTQVNSLVVCDTSGSMAGLPYQVSVSMGLYFAERSPYEGFITFSHQPRWHKVNKRLSLRDKMASIESINIGNTNLEATLDLVLNTSIETGLQPPESIIIISDMQFDQAIGMLSEKVSFFKKMKRRWVARQKKFPNIIFWNVHSNSSTPVTFDETGTALISGYNPAIASAIESEKEMTPMSIMYDSISNINPTM